MGSHRPQVGIRKCQVWIKTRVSTFVLSSILLFSFLPYSFAGEPLAIGKLLSSGRSYNLRHVTIRGIVKEVTTHPTAFSPSHGIPLYPADIFVMEDDSGTIEVMVLGHPVLDSGEAVVVGEVVEVDATMQIFDGSFNGDYYKIVRPLAHNIRRL